MSCKFRIFLNLSGIAITVSVAFMMMSEPVAVWRGIAVAVESIPLILNGALLISNVCMCMEGK